MKVDVFTLDYHDAQQAQDMLFLLENYVLNPMGKTLFWEKPL